MVLASPGVQESTENRKEIAPGKQIPKKCENLGAESKTHATWGEGFVATGGREFTFF